MSRSYRKNPIVKDGKRRRRWIKNQANRKVRRAVDVPNGNMYRRFYCQWDVCDYWDRCTLEEWLHEAHLFEHCYWHWRPDPSWRTEAFTVKEWKKYYYWK